MWFYKSPVGLMRIYQKINRRYCLEISGIVYGTYHSAKAAADDVQSFCTGCDEWDNLSSTFTDYPSDLSEWEHA